MGYWESEYTLSQCFFSDGEVHAWRLLVVAVLIIPRERNFRFFRLSLLTNNYLRHPLADTMGKANIFRSNLLEIFFQKGMWLGGNNKALASWGRSLGKAKHRIN